MRVHTRLLLSALAALSLPGVGRAQAVPVGSASGGPSPFVITPGDPEMPADPARFDLSDKPHPLGLDHDDRMTMEVRIGDVGPYDFVIDTGSQRTIVARELAQRLALPELPPVEIVSMAGRVTVGAVRLGGLHFGDHSVGALDALSIAHTDLGSAGLIGLDSLKNKRLTLDFKKRRMDIGQSRRVAPTNDPDTIVVRARSRMGQLILVDSRIDGRKVNVILDTGAELSVGNMALFRSLKLQRLLVPPQPTVLTSVTGVAVPAQFTVVRHITIGSVTLDNVPMVFLDAAPFDELELGDKPAMLLGMRMLRLFDKVAIDFGNRQVDFHLGERAALADGDRFAALGAPGAARR